MTAPAIPAGVADLADRLAVWQGVINGKMAGVAAYKAVDQSRTSNTTYGDDNDLQLPVVANAVYAVTMSGLYQAHASGGMKAQFTFPSGTMEAPWFFNDPSAADAAAIPAGASPVGQAGFQGTSANLVIVMNGTLFVGATGGTLKLQWAQQSSFATATIFRRGTRMIVARLA